MAQVTRALVVDDDASWQQIIGEILSDNRLEVDTAGTLDEAVLALRSQPHRLAVVDLCLSLDDHNNVDGLRVLDSIRRLDPTCRAILLTGFATVELAVAAITDHGAFTFLRKESFQRSQFREIVSRILLSAPVPSAPGLDPVSKDAAPLKKNPPAAPKALVVEDDAGWRYILEEMLVDAGFQVWGCAGFGDALGVLRREKVSLAVMDLSLQDVSGTGGAGLEGYQLLAAAQAENIPTVVVSGVSEPEEIQCAYAEYGVSAFLEKRAFDRAAFRRAVEETRKARQALNELSALTEREREVLDLLAQGLTNKEIAEGLVITTNTVKRHIKAIFEKLKVHTRSAATAKVTGGQV